MREYQFGSGDERSNFLDVRSRKHPPMFWTLTNVREAMHMHAERFSVERTLTILHEITGLMPCNSVMQRVQPRYYAALIARYTEEVADRPHMVADA